MRESIDQVSTQQGHPLLVALHFLGGNGTIWREVAAELSSRVDVEAIDLPGFGDAAQTPGYDVTSMARHVIDHVRRLAPQRWMLAGHSMGAKVACVVARMVEDGEADLPGLDKLVLIAGSPPAPEPMEDDKRDTMRRWFAGTDDERRSQADRYIHENVAAALSPHRHTLALTAVLSANRQAWLAWLDGGSREDWTNRIGTLRTPTLILAGEQDAALGIDVQRSLMAKHFATVQLRIVPGTAHLLPLECPGGIATLIGDFLGSTASREPDIPASYRALIDSPRVSARTRSILFERAAPVSVDRGSLSVEAFETFKALADRLIPQTGDIRIDIATRLAQSIARGMEDGWRFAKLPNDVSALDAGLQTLDARAHKAHRRRFAALSVDMQHAILDEAVAPDSGAALELDGTSLTHEQFQLWFEDMRSFMTQTYLSHPVTQARIGYAGIANRGDGSGPQGFSQIGLGRRESWEPASRAQDDQ